MQKKKEEFPEEVVHLGKRSAVINEVQLDDVEVRLDDGGGAIVIHVSERSAPKRRKTEPENRPEIAVRHGRSHERLEAAELLLQLSVSFFNL